MHQKVQQMPGIWWDCWRNPSDTGKRAIQSVDICSGSVHFCCTMISICPASLLSSIDPQGFIVFNNMSYHPCWAELSFPPKSFPIRSKRRWGSISILLALTVYSAALQHRVALVGSEDAAQRLAEIWPRFQQLLRQLVQKMSQTPALLDATGFPLLPPLEVIQIWQNYMIFSIPEKSLQDWAEETLEHAQGAYYATEDFYFSRLRPRLLEGCGAVCDVSLQTEGSPSFWVPEYLAEIDTWLQSWKLFLRWSFQVFHIGSSWSEDMKSTFFYVSTFYVSFCQTDESGTKFAELTERIAQPSLAIAWWVKQQDFSRRCVPFHLCSRSKCRWNEIHYSLRQDDERSYSSKTFKNV